MTDRIPARVSAIAYSSGAAMPLARKTLRTITAPWLYLAQSMHVSAVGMASSRFWSIGSRQLAQNP